MRELKDGWVKPFNEQKQSLKIIGKCEVGFIEQKDKHCYKHKLDYISECFKLPSGKLNWSDCPVCKSEIDTRVRIEKPEQTQEIIYQQPIKKAKGF
jgi:hypothetical protein